MYTCIFISSYISNVLTNISVQFDDSIQRLGVIARRRCSASTPLSPRVQIGRHLQLNRRVELNLQTELNLIAELNGK